MLMRLTIIMLLITSCNDGNKIKSQKIDSTYYSTGKIKSIKEYDHGELRSLIEYYKNGNLSGKANYYKGNMIGKVVFFYTDGRKNFEQYYDSMGRSDGTFSLWYRNGNLKQTGKYKADKTVGKWEDFFEDGKLKDIENHCCPTKIGLKLSVSPYR